MSRHLLTFYTRTPLHVGCGTSVDVVDLPIMRERITNFPVIPSTSIKGVLLQAGREKWPSTNGKAKEILHPNNQMLFGAILDEKEGDQEKQQAYAGSVQIMEAKLLAFPVRSLAGCFAWLTCPTALRRFQRDTGANFAIPDLQRDHAAVSSHSELTSGGKVLLEEYALTADHAGDAHPAVVAALKPLLTDKLWQDKLAARLTILHDEDFQHFVSTCTEVVARIVMNPATRTNANLFNQENVPCETLFYTVLQVLKPRRQAEGADAGAILTELLKANPVLQIGGDETTGHGFCEATRHALPFKSNA